MAGRPFGYESAPCFLVDAAGALLRPNQPRVGCAVCGSARWLHCSYGCPPCGLPPRIGKGDSMLALFEATPIVLALSDLVKQDWLNVQYYNQNDYCYSSYQAAFFDSSLHGCWASETAVAQIAAAGVPLEMIVFGKPLAPGDAGSGWVPSATLAEWASQAKADLGWTAGVFAWQYSFMDGADWLAEIYPAAQAGGSPAVAPDVGAVVCESQTQTTSASSSRTRTPSQTPTRTQSSSLSHSPSHSSSLTATFSRGASHSRSMSKTTTGSRTSTSTRSASRSPSSSVTPTLSMSSTASSTEFPLSPNGLCGTTSRGHYRCNDGVCCSKFGYCGTSNAHCGSSCQVRPC